MDISDTDNNTTLGTSLTFLILDYRGKYDFPGDQNGFVFEHRRSIPKTTSTEGYAIRTDDTGGGWRVDYIPQFGPKETVYGPNRESYWPTNEEAAAALELYLKG